MAQRQSSKSPRFEIRNYVTESFYHELSQDVFMGLTADQKSIPSKYFYDKRGSKLYEQICKLPEYYLTRTELSILQEKSEAIMEPFETGDLVELGSGANWKISKLIDAADGPQGAHIRYVPVDVSESALVAAAEDLLTNYPRLRVLGIVADFTRHMEVIPDDSAKLIIFFGSTIGNLTGAESQHFLRNVANALQPEDRFLIGLDMIKPRDILEAAYNDAQGVTSAFNKNILRVINQELHSDFDPSGFEHRAFYSDEHEQVEMHLQANQKTTVEITDLDLSVELEKGETIHTEICRKFSEESALKMFSEVGLKVEHWFTDPKGWFSLVEVVRNTT
ncbi:MAG TPA: L-histidine N(alpha)-methyltransferase [Desulfobacteria bacterium]|nr:L-histidine N(alpha)-methyltransferase [Desulfobacteria bacterium]